MAEAIVEVPLTEATGGRARTPPVCAICLGPCRNKCFSNTCMHEFCFDCLLQWSKIKAECPLCKQVFKSIIHNIKSLEEYDEHVVETITTEETRYEDSIPQYHFRTTFTMNTHGEIALQQMLLRHPLLHIAGFTNQSYPRRRRTDTTTAFRRSIYTHNLWVYAPPDITGRYREYSPQFLRNNPGARTRLVPWLNREILALLNDPDRVNTLVEIILEHLQYQSIHSYIMRSLLRSYFHRRTDHFLHELFNFMRSPYDMIGYDRHIIYVENRRHVRPFSENEDNDEVILVSDTETLDVASENNAEPVIIDLLDSDTNETIIVSDDDDDDEVEEVSTQSRERETSPENRSGLPIKLRLKRKKCRSSQIYSISSTSSSSRSNNSSSSDNDDESRINITPNDSDSDKPLISWAAKKRRTDDGEASTSGFSNNNIKTEVKTENIKNEEEEDRGGESDGSLYSELRRPNVKSKIMRVGDNSGAGPSGTWQSSNVGNYDTDSDI